MSIECTHVPNFIGHIVRAVGLHSATHLNGGIGYTRSWNEEKEKFIVELIHPEHKMVLIKALNLEHIINPKTEDEKNLHQFVNGKTNTNFELGMNLFEKVDDEHHNVYSKLNWLRNMRNYRKGDGNFIDVYKSILENIIKDCRYADLIVIAKIDLADILMEMPNQSSEGIQLLMSCVDNHYGELPRIFNSLCVFFWWGYANRPREEFASLLKGLYHKCKIMIVRRNCKREQELQFTQGCPVLLDNEFLGPDEIISLQRIGEIKLNFVKSLQQKGYEIAWRLLLQKTCYIIGNYQESIKHCRIVREFCTYDENIPHHVSITNTYLHEANSHFQLGNRDMLRKCLKELKKRQHLGPIDKQIEEVEQMIKDLKKESKKSPPKKIKSLDIQTKMKCNYAPCQNKETYVGEFKKCARCRIVRYCSRKCQKKHWKEIHKHQCKSID